METSKTVAFSGYRPIKLDESVKLDILRQKLSATILNVISQGFDTFLVGMAEGFDTWAGEAVIECKKQGHNIKLICVVPVKERISHVADALLKNADNIIYLAENYHPGAYHIRNRYLVDNCELLICYYDGQDGGTSYTVDYATKEEKQVVNIYKHKTKSKITDFHAKYYALELLQKRHGNSDERITNALSNSCLEINPHQVEAALFAFKSPLSKGVLLADEVGLGKTIEAGLVLCQLYAEQKTKFLVICPASLRKQWAMELLEKFNLPSFILESKTHTDFQQIAHNISFHDAQIVIVSYHYAAKIAHELKSIFWDLVVIDEAHKLRNAYRPSNKIGQNIIFGTGESKKLLLTATPLQNNLTELYGLSSIIDTHIFGDIKSFREQYVTDENFSDLKERLNHFCKRTLRKDVREYIKYTKRIGIQQHFEASNAEVELYNAISTFLQKGSVYAVPERQKRLTTLIIRKVLASSTWAVCQTLETILERLTKIQKGQIQPTAALEEFEIFFDEDALSAHEEIKDEIQEEMDKNYKEKEHGEKDHHVIDVKQLESEIEQISHFIQLAKSITTDTKSLSLLEALTVGFQETARLHAHKKALIFTESRRTQDYLKNFLEAHGYAGKIVLFNGQNSGKEATAIYKAWHEENKYTGRTSGSKTADRRMSLIEYFRDTAEICIATEAAAEGVNLQFCSLVINYDLPWNPQRIEQRIGRCHRYGQKHDVVVINFINKKNYADVRVAELLEQKFKLFDGIFGSSDEVLGSIESGVDFEKRIFTIYQECRTPEEIQKEFDILQKEMDVKIKKTMKKTRELLFQNFDSDVHERLKLHITDSLDRQSRLFWDVSKYILQDRAIFFDKYKCFLLKNAPEKNTLANSNLGKYTLISHAKKNTKSYIYRTGHPLGKYVLNTALALPAKQGKVTFDISNHTGHKLSVIEQLQGQSGYLSLHKFTIAHAEQEEYLLFCGFLQDGTPLKADTCRKLFDCAGKTATYTLTQDWQGKLNCEAEQYAKGTLAKAEERNSSFMQEEEERIYKWEQDMIIALEKELVNIKQRTFETERLLRKATSTTEKVALQEKLQELNKRKRNARAKLEENEEKIFQRRDELIKKMRQLMKTSTHLEHVFSIAWEVL